MKALLALLLLAAPIANAQETQSLEAPLPDAAQEAEARALMQDLRCLQCQNQSISDSNAPQAEAMRKLVRERIAAGDDPEAVRAWFIDRYGDWVTFSPPAGPQTALLWAAPVLLVGVGGLVAMRLFRRS